MFKSIVLHERRADLSRAQFMEHWINVHTPMSHGALYLHGYVCHEVLADVTPPTVERLQLEAEVDGIAEMWFETPDGLLTLPEQPSVKRWFSDGPNFIGRRMRFMAEEFVLQKPKRVADRAHKLIALVGLNATADHLRSEDWLREIMQSTAGDLGETRGVCVSQIVSHHPTASVAGFPMDKVNCVLEVLADTAASVASTAERFANALGLAGIESIRMRAFSTSEMVIRVPTEVPMHP